MPQTEIGWTLSFSLSAKNRAQSIEQSFLRSALSSALVSALRVALQRCSYPPHECLESIMLFGQPLAKGTSLFWILGDISILA